MISSKLVAASSVPAILSILCEGESYGYALIQRVKALSGGQLAWTDGMLYPVLHRLEKEGLLRSEWRRSACGRRRKYYRIEPAGQRVLAEERRQWLTVHAALSRLWEGKTRSGEAPVASIAPDPLADQVQDGPGPVESPPAEH